jgi:hypothetical protein
MNLGLTRLENKLILSFRSERSGEPESSLPAGRQGFKGNNVYIFKMQLELLTLDSG